MRVENVIFSKLGKRNRKWYLSGIALVFSLSISCVFLSLLWVFQDVYLSKVNNDGYFTITKPLGLGNTLTGSTSTFSEEEILNLREADFTKSFTIVKKPQFNCFARFFENQSFGTEIILEAIPREIIDNASFRFYWDKDSDKVPVIISAEFLKLYNFVYAPVAGLPPVQSDNLAYIPMSLSISDNSNKITLDAEIIGTSERFNGIFVPESFINYYNQKLSKSKKQRVDKIIVRTFPDQLQSFEKYVSSANYEINSEILRQIKSASFIYPAISIILFILLTLIILSISNFWLQWKWLLENQKGNIQLLFDLGKNSAEVSKSIFKVMIKMLSAFTGIALLISLILWFVLAGLLQDFLGLSSIGFPLLPFLLTILIMLFLSGILFLQLRNTLKSAYS